MSLEIAGSVDEVVRVIQRLGSAGRDATVGDVERSIEALGSSGEDLPPAADTAGAVESREAVPGRWTKDMADDFLAGLEPAARQMVRHVWRTGAAGIHRRALCHRADLSPAEVRSLLIQMSHQLRRFQQERGVMLSRPVVANRPRQSYFIDPDFAAAASQMSGEMMPHPLGDGTGRV